MASLAGTEPASSDAHLVIGVETEEKRSKRRKKRKRMERIAVAMAAAVGAEQQKVVGGQLEPCPFPARRNHPGLGSYKGHRCRLELGRTNYHERRMLAPEYGRNSNQYCRVFEVRGQATSPSDREQ